jgi:hypothetical protein
MHLFRSLADLDAAHDRLLDPELITLLDGYAVALAEFDEPLADLLVIEDTDTLVDAEQASGIRLVIDGRIAFPIELITRHDHWYDIVWVKSDYGEGLVLLVQITPAADAELLRACEQALAAATA